LSFQNKVKKKYISIKVFPKGSNLSKKAITHQIAFEGLRQQIKGLVINRKSC
jgi:hypothetical protein